MRNDIANPSGVISFDHHFQIMFSWQMQIMIGIVGWSIVLYQTTIKIAWYQATFMAFKIDKCPEEPKFNAGNEALVCCGITAFLILSIDNLRLMQIMGHD